MAALSQCEGQNASPYQPRTGTRPHLLAIPQELRNEIYDYLLVHQDKEASQPSSLRFYRDEHEPIRAFISLSLTCRQLHDEAMQVIFGDTKFCFGVFSATYRFPSDWAPLLKHVALCSYGCELYFRKGNGSVEIGVTMGRYRWLVSGPTLQPVSRPVSADSVALAMARTTMPVVQLLQQSFEGENGPNLKTLEMMAAQLRSKWGAIARVAGVRIAS